MILIAIPERDFDPTECSIPWKVLTDAGHKVKFATPSGRAGEADERVITGRGFGPLRAVFAATSRSVEIYNRMRQDEDFRKPIPYRDLDGERFDGLVLPGGHASGMKEYLEAVELQRLAAGFFARNKPVASICHGVIILARARMPETGRSPLFGRKTSALPALMELSAWWSTRLWLGNYFKTYPQTVQEIVTAELERPEDFIVGPCSLRHDTEQNPERGFVVVDGLYVSARWPGDAYRFATNFLEALKGVNYPHD